MHCHKRIRTYYKNRKWKPSDDVFIITICIITKVFVTLDRKMARWHSNTYTKKTLITFFKITSFALSIVKYQKEEQCDFLAINM